MGPAGIIVGTVEYTGGGRPYVCDWCQARVNKIIHCRLPGSGLLCIECNDGLYCDSDAIYIVSAYGSYVYEDFVRHNVEELIQSTAGGDVDRSYRRYLENEYAKFTLSKL